ncbi:MAG: alpha/beta fold hydrolase [Deltaproteobacteria bacterium]|nr:alpha/beta fold hydrolase [Deltaproteobacteria bacterium]
MERPIWFTVGGQTLHGMLHLPERQPAPAVALLHGFTGQRMESAFVFVRLARLLCGAGIAALRFDFRGSGESEGVFSEVTIEREVEDARAALRWLRARPDVDARRVGLLGVSLGATVAMLTAGDEPDLQALCLWATLARPRHRFPLPPEPERRAALRAHGFVDHNNEGFPVGRAFYESAARVDPVAAMERYRGPLLCVHGERDYLPLEEPQLVIDRTAASSKSLHVVPEGEHVFGPWAAKTEAVEVTRDFFVRTLTGGARAKSPRATKPRRKAKPPRTAKAPPKSRPSRR